MTPHDAAAAGPGDTEDAAERGDTDPDSAADAAELLAEMRRRVEAIAGEIERLTHELAARDAYVDELETVVDAVLGELAEPLLVIGDDGRILALSRGAARHVVGGGEPIGQPLSSVLSEDTYAYVAGRMASGADAVDEVEAVGAVGAGGATEADPSDDRQSGAVHIEPLPSGGAVVVLRGR